MVVVAGDLGEEVDVQDAEAVIQRWVSESGRAVPKTVMADGLRTMYGPGSIPGTAKPKPGWRRNKQAVKQRFLNCPKK
jgi:hypothetical protein